MAIILTTSVPGTWFSGQISYQWTNKLDQNSIEVWIRKKGQSFLSKLPRPFKSKFYPSCSSHFDVIYLICVPHFVHLSLFYICFFPSKIASRRRLQAARSTLVSFRMTFPRVSSLKKQKSVGQKSLHRLGGLANWENIVYLHVFDNFDSLYISVFIWWYMMSIVAHSYAWISGKNTEKQPVNARVCNLSPLFLQSQRFLRLKNPNGSVAVRHANSTKPPRKMYVH